MNYSKLAVALLGALAVAGPALATPTFDTSAATGGLGAIGAALALVGAAKMAPAAIAVGWKWIKAMIFG